MKYVRQFATAKAATLGLAAALVAGTTASPVYAQGSSTWPTRAVRIIATSPPGGSIDLLARLVADECTKTFGQTFVVENRNGANGNVGADAVVKDPADGYNWFVTIPGVFAINQWMYKNMPFDPDKDIAPVAYLGSAPLILVVPSSAPPKNFTEFLAWARANPGKLAYSSQGVGNTGHLGMELLKQMASLDILHVPYRGSAAALNDLLAGNVQMTMLNAPGALPYMQKGMLRGLAVAEPKRIPSAPDIPTIAEAGVPGFELVPWWGMGTKAGVPQDIIDKVNAAATRAMTRPDNVERLKKAGIVFEPMTSQQFAAYIDVERKKWGDVIKRSGATVDD